MIYKLHIICKRNICSRFLYELHVCFICSEVVNVLVLLGAFFHAATAAAVKPLQSAASCGLFMVLSCSGCHMDYIISAG